MSPIGRIFVVINLALSGLFLGWAASNLSTAQKYRSESEASAAALADARDQFAATEADLNSRVAEAERLRSEALQQRDQAAAQRDGFEQDWKSSQDRVSQLDADLGNISSTIGDLRNELAQLRSNVTTANEQRVEAVNAQRDAEEEKQAAEAARQDAENRANDLAGQVADLSTELKSARDEMQDLQTSLDVAVASGFDPNTALAAPPIEGSVTAFSDAVGKGLVQINRGANDQVKRGYVFNLYNGQTFKGLARVDIVNDSTCTARIIELTPGTTVRSGDTASTQI